MTLLKSASTDNLQLQSRSVRAEISRKSVSPGLLPFQNTVATLKKQTCLITYAAFRACTEDLEGVHLAMRLEALHMLMSPLHANTREGLEEVAASKDAHL